jgi:hypothetical protein
MENFIDFIIKKLKITFCFVILLVMDMLVAAVIFFTVILLCNFYHWLGGPTDGLYLFITQLSGIGCIILYVIFSLITIISSIALLRDYL